MLKHPCSQSCFKSNKIKINIVSYVRYKLSKTTFVVLLRQQKVLQIKDHLKSLFSQKQGREGGRFLYMQTKARREEQGGGGGRSEGGGRGGWSSDLLGYGEVNNEYMAAKWFK